MKALSVNSCCVRGLCVSGALLLVLAMPGVLGAQGNPEPLSFKFDRGQDIQPIFAGWAHNPDGSYAMYFGYINRNYVETPSVPVGADNRFGPGAADRGQPTVFNPRIHTEVFHVDVPADWGPQQQLVWTLVVHGKEQRAVGWLEPTWEIDPIYHGKSRDAESLKNKPPVLTVASAATASVATPLELTATVTDDGLPKPKGPRKAAVGQETPPTLKPDPNQPEIVMSVPEVAGRGRGGAAGGAQGLTLSWIVWRGPDNAKFDHAAIPVKDQKATVQVTFPKPGTYILRGTANDGELKVEKDVTVTVK